MDIQAKNKAGEICNSLIFDLTNLYSIYKTMELNFDSETYSLISRKDIPIKQKIAILLELLRREDPELDDQLRTHFFTITPIDEFVTAS